MSIIDWLFVGNVIKDFGSLEQKSLRLGTITFGRFDERVLLTEKRGTLHVVLKSSSWLIPLGASIGYREYPIEKARRLKDFIDEAEDIARATPTSAHDSTSTYGRVAVVLGIIGGILLALTQSMTVAVALVVALLTTYAKLFHDARRSAFVDHEKLSVWMRALSAIVGLAGIVKLVLLALPK